MPQDLESILGTRSQQQASFPTPATSETAKAGDAVSVVYRQVSALTKRYRDAYLVARATVGIGTTIKVVGFVLGILTTLGGIILGGNMQGETAFAAYILGLLIGGLVLVQFYIFGVLVSFHSSMPLP